MSLQRWFLELSFTGTAFHGWARQPNALGVQELLEEALSRLFGSPQEATGAGRTDAGVHARSLWVHVDLPKPGMDAQDLLHKLNCMLPKEIAIRRALPVPDHWHARFSAVSRSYTYRFLKRKDPFWSDFAWRVHPFPSLERMQEAASLLPQNGDFASFCRSQHDARTTVCHNLNMEWEWQGQLLLFHISADRFLRNMVRALVGTLVEIGQEKHPPQHLLEVFLAQNRQAAGPSAPAKGLCLESVRYPEGWLDSENH